MSEFAALSSAAQQLHLTASKGTPVALVADSGAGILSRASEGIVRLTAKARHAAAVANAGSVIPQEDSDSYNAIKTAAVHAQQMQYLCQSSALYELFTKPTADLTSEESDLKQETITNMTALVEIDAELTAVHNATVGRKERIDELTKEWDSVFNKFQDKKNEFTNAADTDDSEPSTQKQALEKTVNKMNFLREIIVRLVPAMSAYDFMDDKEGLMDILATVRDPFTVESVLRDINQSEK